MIPDATPAVSVNTILPAIENKDGKTIVTYSLTVEESLYLTWQYNGILGALAQKTMLFFLGASPQMQQAFNTVIREFTQQQPPALQTVTSSIASKTATYVMNTLKLSGKQAEIDDELKQKQIIAEILQQSGNLKGAFITAREANVILTFVEQYPKSK